jgi:N-formylglutamate amidohydrolase
MKKVEGQAHIPFIFTAHHASDNFAEFSDRCALSPLERKAYSDYGTDITVPKIGSCAIIAEVSRGLVDLNRFPDDPTRFATTDFASPPNTIWRSDQQPTTTERHAIVDTYFAPFHNAVKDAIDEHSGLTFVVAWDNTADKIIGQNDTGEDVRMPAIILSNNGTEGSAENHDGLQATCDARLLELAAKTISDELGKSGFANEVCLNLVFKSKFIAQNYSTYGRQAEKPIQSFQVEYSSALTHDQQTLKDLGRMEDFREAMERALITAYEQYKLLQ